MAKNITQHIRPSQEQDAQRRAIKQHQRLHAGGAKGKQTSWLAEQLVDAIAERKRAQEDWQRGRDEAVRKAAARRLEQAQQREAVRLQASVQIAAQKAQARKNQAAMATEHPAFKALKPGTVAYKIAGETLLAFADVEVPADRSITRTQAALMIAGSKLTLEEMLQVKAIDKGEAVAKAALSWAYVQIKPTTATP